MTTIIKEKRLNAEGFSYKKPLAMARFEYIVICLLFCYCCGTFGHNQTSITSVEESRKKGYGGLGWHSHHHLWGPYALALLYFIKIKAVVVAFFVGAAAFWGFKYVLGRGYLGGCGQGVYREGPIVGYNDEM